MSITLNTVAFTQDAFLSADKVQYTSPAHSFTSKDVLSLGRTAPKPTATFAGVARCEAKRIRTVTLADGSKADASVTVVSSLPVGMAKADVDALRDDVGDLCIAAEGEALFWNHDLTF